MTKLLKVVNKVKSNMATKKKRSAKQRANDKKLGLMAKKRFSKTSKTKTKKKTTKRKTTSKSRINTTGLTQTDINMMKKIKNQLADKKVKSVVIKR